MTKEKIRKELQAGKKLDDIFTWSPGQECYIYKGTWDDRDPDKVIYMPDLDLNHIVTDRSLNNVEIDDAIDNMYTMRDFCKLTCGMRSLGKELFYWCDWQHPSTVIGEVGATLEMEEKQFFDLTGLTFEAYTQKEAIFNEMASNIANAQVSDKLKGKNAGLLRAVEIIHDSCRKRAENHRITKLEFEMYIA